MPVVSVFEQDISEVEIILVDDGSTDNTRKLIQRKYDDRVCYCYQENQGIPSARNTGIKKARGKYIAFLDSDDFWLPEKLQKQISFLEENNGYAGTSHQSLVIYENNNSEQHKFSNNSEAADFIIEDLIELRKFHSASFVFRGNIIQKTENFPQCSNARSNPNLLPIS